MIDYRPTWCAAKNEATRREWWRASNREKDEIGVGRRFFAISASDYFLHTSSRYRHERTDEEAAFSLLGSPWHFVVGSGKKIIALDLDLSDAASFQGNKRHYRAEFYESAPYNLFCRGRWEDRYTRLLSLVTRSLRVASRLA